MASISDDQAAKRTFDLEMHLSSIDDGTCRRIWTDTKAAGFYPKRRLGASSVTAMNTTRRPSQRIRGTLNRVLAAFPPGRLTRRKCAGAVGLRSEESPVGGSHQTKGQPAESYAIRLMPSRGVPALS